MPVLRKTTSNSARQLLVAGRIPPRTEAKCISKEHVGPFTESPMLGGWLGHQWVQCERCRSHIVAPEGGA